MAATVDTLPQAGGCRKDLVWFEDAALHRQQVRHLALRWGGGYRVAEHVGNCFAELSDAVQHAAIQWIVQQTVCNTDQFLAAILIGAEEFERCVGSVARKLHEVPESVVQNLQRDLLALGQQTLANHIPQGGRCSDYLAPVGHALADILRVTEVALRSAVVVGLLTSAPQVRVCESGIPHAHDPCNDFLQLPFPSNVHIEAHPWLVRPFRRQTRAELLFVLLSALGADVDIQKAPSDAMLAARVEDRCSTRALKAVEVGVFKADLSMFLLESFPLLRLVGVDSYEQENDQNLRTATERYLANGRGVLWRERSVAAARWIADESLDLVFIDGDHSAEGVAADIAAWAPKVVRGGVVSGHDFAMEFEGSIHAVVAALPPGKTLHVGADSTWWWFV